MGRLVEIHRDHIRSPAMTFSWAGRAYEVAPTRVELRERLELCAEAADAWDELTTLFEGRIATGEASQEEGLAPLVLFDRFCALVSLASLAWLTGVAAASGVANVTATSADEWRRQPPCVAEDRRKVQIAQQHAAQRTQTHRRWSLG